MMNRLKSFLIASIMLFMAYWSFLWFYADLISLIPRTTLIRWEKDLAEDSEKSAERALEIASKASRLNNGNADYFFLQGKIHEWKAVGGSIYSEQGRKERKLAVKKYREVIKRRPTHSLAWVSMAQSRFLLTDIDKTLFFEMKMADLYGPWDEVTQLKLIWVGLSVWPSLPPDERKMVIASIKRTMIQEQISGHVIRIAIMLGKENIIKPLIRKPWLKREFEKQVKESKSQS